MTTKIGSRWQHKAIRITVALVDEIVSRKRVK